MKTVYVDVALITNFALDYILLYLTGTFLHIKVHIKRMVLGAVAGSVCALTITLFPTNAFLDFLLQFFVLLLMIRLSYNKKDAKAKVRIVITMYMFSLLLDGFISLIFSRVNQNANDSVFTISIIVSAVGFLLLSKKISPVYSLEASKKSVKLLCQTHEKSAELTLLVDSGNVLIDTYTGIPIILLSTNAQITLLDCEYINEETIEKYKLLPNSICTAAGSGLVYVMTPKRVVLNNETELDCKIGFCQRKMNDFSGFDGVIPSCFIQQ